MLSIYIPSFKQHNFIMVHVADIQYAILTIEQIPEVIILSPPLCAIKRHMTAYTMHEDSWRPLFMCRVFIIDVLYVCWGRTEYPVTLCQVKVATAQVLPLMQPPVFITSWVAHTERCPIT